MDPFERNQEQEIYHPASVPDDFPDFNTRWLPQFDEGIETETGKNLEKGSDILKKASSFYIFGLGLIALIITFPAILRFLYEFSRWAYNWAGDIF